MAKKEDQPQLDPTLLESRRELLQAQKEYQRKVRLTTGIPMARKIGLVLWAVFDASLVLLLAYVVFGYLVVGQFSDRDSVASMFSQIGSLHDESLERAPEALVITGAIVMDTDSGKYDFYALMENANEDWYATFSYAFETEDDLQTEFIDGFVFPGEVRPLIALSQSLEQSPSQAELVVEELVWHRIDPRDVEDPLTWLDQHQHFTLAASQYGDKIELEEGVIVRSNFTIENKSPFNYWEAPFWLILERGGSVVGVNQFTMSNFEAGEARDVTVNWFGSAPSSAQSISVYPAINYFDTDVYMSQPKQEDVDSRQ